MASCEPPRVVEWSELSCVSGAEKRMIQLLIILICSNRSYVGLGLSQIYSNSTAALESGAWWLPDVIKELCCLMVHV
jgi:hypothetical protein